jgi:alkylated DNA repair dioxygenase AlkB
MTDLHSLGLILIPDFLTESEEQDIVSRIPESKGKKRSSERNSVRRFGSNTPYKNQIESSIIPDYLDRIGQKLVESQLLLVKPNSISINEYLPGNAIAPHIDSIESGPIITILSLLSDATMVLNHPRQQEQQILVPKLSILQLKDEIRYSWTHAILPVQHKRYSIVFRNG